MPKKAEQSRRIPVLWHMRAAYGQVWRWLVAGLLVWIPLLISLWVAWFVIDLFILGIENGMREFFPVLNTLGTRFPVLAFLQYVEYKSGMGLLFTVAIFLSTGILARYLIGRRLIAFGEKIVQLIPFVNRVYRAVQQIRDVFITRQGTIFQRVCLVEYPRPGMVAVAFVTSSEQGVVQRTVNRELLAVFVPTTPNPTSGYLVYLAPEEVTLLDVDIEEGMKLIVSGGAYMPAHGGLPPGTTAASPAPEQVTRATSG